MDKSKLKILLKETRLQYITKPHRSDPKNNNQDSPNNSNTQHIINYQLDGIIRRRANNKRSVLIYKHEEHES